MWWPDLPQNSTLICAASGNLILESRSWHPGLQKYSEMWIFKGFVLQILRKYYSQDAHYENNPLHFRLFINLISPPKQMNIHEK